MFTVIKGKVHPADYWAAAGIILIAIMLVGHAYAAPPLKCNPDLLPEFVARVTVKHYSTQFTAEQIADSSWRDLGDLRRRAKDRTNGAIHSYLQDREGAYDWISTKAAEAGVEPYVMVSRLIDCAMLRDVDKALLRDKQRGTAHEFLAEARSGKKPDAEWLVKSLRRNMNEVIEARKE